MTTQTTAAQAYARNRRDIARVMDWLQLELDRHGEDAKARPNWGHVGDLGHVRQQLIETLAAISGHEAAEIENLLSE